MDNSGVQVWQDPKRYKPCRGKMFTLYVCKPEVGIVIVNKAEHPDIVKYMLGGRDYFTKADLKRLSGTPVYAYLMSLVKSGVVAKCVTGSDFVLCGTVGELSVVPWLFADDRYAFFDNGVDTPLSAASVTARLQSDGTMLWQALRPTQRYLHRYKSSFACFVQQSVSGEYASDRGSFKLNCNGISHGLGDFIVCDADKSGLPVMRTGLVVNGDVFKHTFNNQGWANCLSDSIPMSLQDLPKLVALVAKSRGVAIPKSLISLRNSLISVVRSGMLVSYNTQTKPEIYTSIPEDLSNRLMSYCNLVSFRFVFGVHNCSDNVYVFCSNDGRRVAVVRGSVLANQYAYSVVSIDDIAKIRKIIVLLSCLKKKGFMSCFRSSYLNAESAKALCDYTTTAFINMNDSIKQREFDRFDVWEMCRGCYNALKESQFSGVRIYRGIRLDKCPSVGDIIKSDVFSSWSLSLRTPEDFAGYNGYVLTVNVTTPVEALYISSLSLSPDQYEVVLNAGYNVKIVGSWKINSLQLLECELIKDESFRLDIESAFAVDEQLTEENLCNSIASLPMSNSSVGKLFYTVITTRNTVSFSSRFAFQSKQSSMIIVRVRPLEKKISFYKDNLMVPSYLDVPITTYRETIQSVARELVKLGRDQNEVERPGISRFGVEFMFNITSLFQREGYQILEQSFDSPDLVENRLSGHITVSGDNDDHLVVRFLLCSSGVSVKIRVGARSGNSKLVSDFDGLSDTLYQDIFSVVVHKFNLSQHHRVEQALTLVSKFKKLSYKLEQDAGVSAVYRVGDTLLRVRYDGNMIVFNDVSSVFFYDNLRVIAKAISEIVA